jgi:hypothetical protein
MKIFVALIALLCIALVSCGCMSTPPADEPGTTPPATASPQTETPTPEPAASFASFSGSGTASRTLDLKSGVYLLEMEHEGSGPFVVEVESATVYQSIVHVNGSFAGTQAFGVPDAGTFFLNVTADGGWTIYVERPLHLTDVILPYTFTGTGYAATGLFDLPEGNVTFAIARGGEGPFAVWLYAGNGLLVFDSNGTYIQPLSLHEGPFNGTETVTIPSSGAYLLDVMGTGDWSVTVGE